MKPLSGFRVIELAGMVLADFGAEENRVDRIEGGRRDYLSRGKKSIQIDLKKAEVRRSVARVACECSFSVFCQGRKLVLDMCERADVLIEPFRPGVMEKLGLGPEECAKRNKGLVYARLTGFGQTGKYSQMAGHDNNYLAVAGVLSALGRAEEKPFFPQNLLADFAGGGLMCALGVAMALLERAKSGQGQVVDVAMVDGAAYLASMSYVARNALYGMPRGTNMLDGGAPFYEVYECADAKYVAVGAIEPQFFKRLLAGLGVALEDELWQNQLNTALWPQQKRQIAAIFKSKSQAEWSRVFDKEDACVTPLLTWEHLESHPHTGAAGRGLVVDVNGEKQIAPAPRLLRTPATPGAQEPETGEHTEEVLSRWLSQSQIDQLRAHGAIAGAKRSRL
jgi:alpha-methylacyl-CoA racemase